MKRRSIFKSVVALLFGGNAVKAAAPPKKDFIRHASAWMQLWEADLKNAELPYEELLREDSGERLIDFYSRHIKP